MRGKDQKIFSNSLLKNRRFLAYQKAKLFEDIKLLKTIDLGEIAEKTKIDEFSKILNLREHLLVMLWYVIGDCITLTELSDSLKGILPERYHLVEISKSQLSKVNKSRDYRTFVWAFYELIDQIWRDRKHWKMKRDLKILGID